MKLLFAVCQYYPGGGMNDCIGKFENTEQALDAAKSFRNDFDWFQILDLDTLTIEVQDEIESLDLSNMTEITISLNGSEGTKFCPNYVIEKQKNGEAHAIDDYFKSLGFKHDDDQE